MPARVPASVGRRRPGAPSAPEPVEAPERVVDGHDVDNGEPGGPAAPAAAAPLEAVGDVAMLTGDLAAALDAYRGVAALAAPGDPAGLAVATANLALTLAYAGDEEAAGVAEEGVAAALASANPTAVAMARFAEGEAFADADPARAATALTAVRRRLGQAAYERAWAAGTVRALEDAADDARRLLDQPGDPGQGPGGLSPQGRRGGGR
jgi:hypothetical protein